MHMLQLLPVVAGLAVALPTEAPIQARQTAVPTGVTVASVNYVGAGCPAANLTSFSVPNAGTIAIPRSIWKAESGVDNTRVAENRVGCTTTISVNHPAGWQFALVKADYYGRVKVPLGVEAISRTVYSFSGDSASKASQYYFDGPFDGIYYRNDRYIDSARTWSKCGSGAALIVNSEVRVAPIGNAVANKPASMEIYNFLGNQIGLQWKKC
ncbi:hypothetical protein QBC37DRAFT_434236 [Rhypophila decipiens]|uniref:Secreted protein n=1 Tax=Rhypophila decipiens TaxID=261697 RepID=A0AAN6XWE3_9PEZI|nr:hypothetical protein QBC37DRAFT_434236 [Rhypophila decipiens]